VCYLRREYLGISVYFSVPLDPGNIYLEGCNFVLRDSVLYLRDTVKAVKVLCYLGFFFLVTVVQSPFWP
jgi:hypothetical protein